MSVKVNEARHAMGRFGDDILSATEEGKSVSYVYSNPETGEEGRKNAWIVRHDGLYFGSSW